MCSDYCRKRAPAAECVSSSHPDSHESGRHVTAYLVMQGMLEAAMGNTAQHVNDTELPIEGAKTTLSNPMFQQEADDVSDVEELR